MFTHPDPVGILLSCVMFFMFFAWLILRVIVDAKRLSAWFARRAQLRHPPSVHMTLNQMNVTAEDVDYMRSRHARIDSGVSDARTRTRKMG